MEYGIILKFAPVLICISCSLELLDNRRTAKTQLLKVINATAARIVSTSKGTWRKFPKLFTEMSIMVSLDTGK